MYIDLHVKVPVILARFQRILNFLDVFWKKKSNVKFYEHSSIGSRVVPWGQTEKETDRQTHRDKINVIFALRNFAGRT